jgi:hypothetical protein
MKTADGRPTKGRRNIELSKLKLTVIDGHHILRAIIKEQREIFSAFALSPPL